MNMNINIKIALSSFQENMLGQIPAPGTDLPAPAPRFVFRRGTPALTPSMPWPPLRAPATCTRHELAARRRHQPSADACAGSASCATQPPTRRPSCSWLGLRCLSRVNTWCWSAKPSYRMLRRKRPLRVSHWMSCLKLLSNRAGKPARSSS